MNEIYEGKMDIKFEDMLKSDEIYNNFTKNVIANDRIWFLFNDGKVAVAETEAGDAVALWGSKEAAKKNQMNEWKDFSVESMTIAEFLLICVPEFSQNNVAAMVEMQNGEGIWKNLIDLETDFENEAEAQGFDVEAACREVEEAMESMEAEEYYEQLLEEIISEGGIWTLFNDDDDLVMADTDEGGVIPMWNSYEKAADMCCEEWKECSPEFVSVTSCLEELLPLLDYDEIKILLVTNDEMGGITLSAEDFAVDLENAIDISGYDIDETPKHEKKAKEKNNVIPFPKLS